MKKGNFFIHHTLTLGWVSVSVLVHHVSHEPWHMDQSENSQYQPPASVWINWEEAKVLMISFIQEKNFPSTCLLHPSEYNIVNWRLQKSTENILLHVFSTFFLQNFESSSFSYKHTLYRTRLKDKSVLLTGYNYFSFTFFSCFSRFDSNSERNCA